MHTHPAAAALVLVAGWSALPPQSPPIHLTPAAPSSTATSQQALPPSKASGSLPKASAVIAGAFDLWDLDHDGELSAVEVDRLVGDPAYTGERAAALAALKLALRSTRIEPVPLTTALFLQTSGGDNVSVRLGTGPDDDREVASGVTKRKKLDPKETIAAIQSRYARAFKKISGVKREVFLDETPDIDRCRQGSLGDCFLIAAVGAYAHRNPQDVRKMIRPIDGGYVVTLGQTASVRVLELTDAQIGLTSSTGDEGLWLAIVEQAYGTLRNDTKPVDQKTEEASDAIARGGSMSSTISALTGHGVRTTSLRGRYENAKAKNQPLEPILAQVRALLLDAMKNRHLAGSGTASTDTGVTLPPGINGNHAYAVLAFDETRDVVTIWNPHGNSFTPKGEPGLRNGYVTKAGQFEIPLEDYVATFRGLSVETDAPPPVRKRKPAKAST